VAKDTTKRAFYKGLAALLPTVLTVFILVKVYEFVSGTLGKWLTNAMVWVLAKIKDVPFATMQQEAPRYLPYLGTLLGLILAFLLAVFVGFALASFIGRKTWGFVERRFFSFPIVSLIYPSIKQITDFVFGEQKVAFKRIGLLEYPRKGVYSIGFITGPGFRSIQERTRREMVTFFIPSSPTPFTGYCVQVFRDEIIELDLPVESVIRYIVSGGVILPAREGGAPVVEDVVAALRVRENSGDREDADKEDGTDT